MSVKCFKCERELTAAVVNEDNDDEAIWNCPNGGVVFSGGNNYGSSLYDSMMDGRSVSIIVCDRCLEWAEGTDSLKIVADPSFVDPVVHAAQRKRLIEAVKRLRELGFPKENSDAV